MYAIGKKCFRVIFKKNVRTSIRTTGTKICYFFVAGKYVINLPFQKMLIPDFPYEYKNG
jgi:hypothetical protein